MAANGYDVTQMSSGLIPDPMAGGSGLGGASPALFGDPYCDRDETTRGVSLAWHGSGTVGHDAMPGDCYSKAFDTGCGALGGPFELSSGSPFLEKNPYEDIDANFPKVATLARFSNSHAPPKVPEDPLFELEKTVVHVGMSRDSPADVGEEFLAFLNTPAAPWKFASLDVDEKTYSMKVVIFLDPGECKVAARLYSNGINSDNLYAYVLELQRSRGDVLAFHAFYQEVGHHFRNQVPLRFVAVDVPGLSPPPRRGQGWAGAGDGFSFDLPPPPPFDDFPDAPPDFPGLPPAGPPSVNDLTPILEMAADNCADHVGVNPQAEAATALSGLARTAATRAVLCTNAVFETIQLLLQSSQLLVVYPTSQLLLELTKSGEAAGCFAKDGLLVSIVREVCNESTCEMLKTELANVIRDAVALCSGQLKADTKGELAKALAGAPDQLSGFPKVAKTLKEAARYLKDAGGRSSAP